jgi:hypothetical protein
LTFPDIGNAALCPKCRIRCFNGDGQTDWSPTVHAAVVLDRHWNVVRTNEAAPRFFGSFLDLEMRPKPRNLLDLTGFRGSA